MKKIFIAITLTLLMICSVCSANLKVKMLNVGQGDAILIQTSTQNVLIDTSDVDEREKLKLQLYKAGAYKLDKIILTHPHADHIGNVQWLIKNGVFKVASVYDNGIASTSKYYLNYVTECASRRVLHASLKEGDVLDLGDGATLKIIHPPEMLVKFRNSTSYQGDPNNEGIIGILTYGNFKMLFSGDAGAAAEKTVLPLLEHCAVMTASHHGSYTSSTFDFVNAVKPDYVLISAGEPTDKRGGNHYGHPHVEVLDTFLNVGVPKENILWTYPNGTITVNTDGQTWNVTPEIKNNWLDRYLLEKMVIEETIDI